MSNSKDENDFSSIIGIIGSSIRNIIQNSRAGQLTPKSELIQFNLLKEISTQFNSTRG
jgi:hypothetical protein